MDGWMSVPTTKKGSSCLSAITLIHTSHQNWIFDENSSAVWGAIAASAVADVFTCLLYRREFSLKLACF
jgi:hypothetical protein